MKQAIVILAAVLLAACGRGPEADGQAGETIIFVSIAPQAEMVERLAGTGVRIEVLVPPGRSPHVYEPSPRQLTDLGRAAAFVTIGVNFEEQVLPQIRQTYPKLAIIDGIAGLERRVMEGHHHHHHHDDDDEDCDHEGLDPHVWLGPPQLEQVARNVAAGLSRLDPENAPRYEANLAAYLADLQAVHEQLEVQLLPFAGRRIYVFHPAFGYFTAAYGLRQEAVELGGRAPTPRQLQQLIEAAKADEVKVIFVQPQFDRRATETIATAIGGAVVPLDPLARDVLTNLRRIGDSISDALAKEQP